MRVTRERVAVPAGPLDGQIRATLVTWRLRATHGDIDEG
jgi:hypothetical protein